MAVFTLVTDYPFSETGYPLDNSRQTDNNLKMKRFQCLIFDEQSA